MVTLIRREFTVSLPLEGAWEHLSRIEQWPSWAPHIRRIQLHPPGELGPQSAGVLHLSNGMQVTFRVNEFNPPRNWKWSSRLLWLTVGYDHLFEGINATHTKVIFVVDAQGFGASVLGRPFAKIYRRNLEKAVPLLIAEMNAESASV